MLPKKVKKRASLLAITLLVSVAGIFLILQSLNKNILYFKSPTDIKNNQNINFDKKIRVGGMVKKNSLIIKEEEIKFIQWRESTKLIKFQMIGMIFGKKLTSRMILFFHVIQKRWNGGL